VLNAVIYVIHADIWKCCQLYKDCTLFQYDVNKPASWKFVSAAENIVHHDKIVMQNSPTSAQSAETVVVTDGVYSHELDVYTG